MEIGLLHPGEMGAGIAATLVSRGHHLLWVPEGRSADTAGRAAAAGMEAVASIDELVARSAIIVSVCPPRAALDVARLVAGAKTRFVGTYLDANAISPATAEAVSSVVTGAGARYVDGGVIGAPPRQGHSTHFYVSGPGAPDVVEQFSTPALEVIALDGSPTSASALKMAYAAWTKGTAALILDIRAAATHYGVDEALLGEWAQSIPALAKQSDRAAVAAMTKGWRWIGEMEEIAATLRGAGLPDGFGLAAADVFRRVPRQAPRGDATDLARVLDDLSGQERAGT